MMVTSRLRRCAVGSEVLIVRVIPAGRSLKRSWVNGWSRTKEQTKAEQREAAQDEQPAWPNRTSAYRWTSPLLSPLPSSGIVCRSTSQVFPMPRCLASGESYSSRLEDGVLRCPRQVGAGRAALISRPPPCSLCSCVDITSPWSLINSDAATA